MITKKNDMIATAADDPRSQAAATLRRRGGR